MNSIVLVINNIDFPYNLFEDALEWAKEHGSRFHAVFLTNDETLTGDRQPSHTESGAGSLDIISQHLKFMQVRVTICHIAFSSVIIVKPTVAQVVEQIRYVDKVFIEFQNNDDLKQFGFTWDNILNGIPMHRQVISNKAYR